MSSDLNLGVKFQETCSRFGSRPAVTFLDNSDMTYDELNNLANKIANFLIEEGLEKGDCIALSSEKRWESYALIVACWKLGLTYSFFDRYSPNERLDKILSQCQAKYIIGNEEVFEKLSSSFKGKKISYNYLNDEYSKKSAENLLITNDISSKSIAYIMFTSGSTGFPKGVTITHENLLNFSNWTQELYGISENDILSHLNPLYFDNSVYDLYATLFTGASLVAFSRADLKDPKFIMEKVDEFRLTSWFSVPSMLVYLINLGSVKDESFKSVKRIIFGGEGFPKNKLKELFDLVRNRVQLINVYGPTEGTCICSSYPISDFDFSEEQMSLLAPLGQDMLPIFEYHIVDSDNREVPVGEVGELLLGGAQLSLGYIGNEEGTRDAFIVNPFLRDSGERVYKTGDLVRKAENGLIYFSGRKDSQIKFMGYRIELGEIESALNSLDFIEESSVVFGGAGEVQEIVAYVVSTTKASVIKKNLKDQLPSYMIPRKIRFLDVLPKNTSGKVDRKRILEELNGEN